MRANVPYTQLLLDAIPKLNSGSFDAPGTPGELPDPVNPAHGCPFAPSCPGGQYICRAERPRLRPVSGSGPMAACHLQRFAKNLNQFDWRNARDM